MLPRRTVWTTGRALAPALLWPEATAQTSQADLKALGGDVLMAGGGSYTFRPDGTFSGGNVGSVSTANVAAGSRQSTGGTYSVSGYGLTLRGAGGQEQRLFFARYDRNLLYIGGPAYTPKR